MLFIFCFMFIIYSVVIVRTYLSSQCYDTIRECFSSVCLLSSSLLSLFIYGSSKPQLLYPFDFNRFHKAFEIQTQRLEDF